MESTPIPARESAPRRRSGARTRTAVLATVVALLALVLLWGRGQPSFIAWEVARDHERCFGREHLRARLWSSDPGEVRGWLEARGTPVQPLPRRPGDVELVGARYCPLADRFAAHVYYGGQGSLVSVMVLGGPAEIGDGWAGSVGSLQVRLLRSAGRTVAVIGEVESDVDAVAHAFRVSRA